MREIPFDIKHVRGIRLRPFHRLGMGAGGVEVLETMAGVYARLGPAFTIEHNGEIAACGGVAVQSGATGDAWMLTSPVIGDIPLAAARCVKRRLNAIEHAEGLTRIQTTVHERHDPARAWFRFLGFTREALLRKLVGDDNFYLYARVR